MIFTALVVDAGHLRVQIGQPVRDGAHKLQRCTIGQCCALQMVVHGAVGPELGDQPKLCASAGI